MQKIISYIYESESEVFQSHPTLCDPIDCSLPGSSVHRIFQATVLEWIAISFSRGSSQPRAWTRVSFIINRHVTIWATREIYYLKFGNCFYRYCYFLYNCSQKHCCCWCQLPLFCTEEPILGKLAKWIIP